MGDGGGGEPAFGPTGGEAVPARGVAHWPQNFSSGSLGDPQLGHATVSGAAHCAQKRRPGLFSLPHLEQITRLLPA